MDTSKELSQLLELEKHIESLEKEALTKKIKQWVRRIEQFEAMNNEAKAKKLFKELRVMVRVYRQNYKEKESIDGILSEQFQGKVLSEGNIDDKLARYYQRFGDSEPLPTIAKNAKNSPLPTEGKLPSQEEKQAIREEGYSLTILKSLSGSNPFSEDNIGGFPKLDKGAEGEFPKLHSKKQDELGSLGFANFPKLKKKDPK